VLGFWVSTLEARYGASTPFAENLPQRTCVEKVSSRKRRKEGSSR